MTFKARNTGVMMVALDTTTFRFPQKTDKFKVKLTDDLRQYVVINNGHLTPTTSVVTFAVSATGTKLASCTCMDFQSIKRHGRQCKHINVAYTFHTQRMAARKAAETIKAVPTSLPVTSTRISPNHVPMIKSYGKITVR